MNTLEYEYIPQLTKSVKHLQAQLSIAESKIAFMETVMSGRKERASGKRVILKDHFVYIKPEILEHLKAAEKATKEWKRKRPTTAPRKCKAASLEVESTLEDTDDQSEGAIRRTQQPTVQGRLRSCLAGTVD